MDTQDTYRIEVTATDPDSDIRRYRLVLSTYHDQVEALDMLLLAYEQQVTTGPHGHALPDGLHRRVWELWRIPLSEDPARPAIRHAAISHGRLDLTTECERVLKGGVDGTLDSFAVTYAMAQGKTNQRTRHLRVRIDGTSRNGERENGAER